MTLPDCMLPDGADPCKGYHEMREGLTFALNYERGLAKLRGEENALLQAENKQLQEALLREGANRYWEGRWRDEFADNTRLRELLKGVIREADRETNAFIAARAAVAEHRGEIQRPLGRPLTPIDD
jgi:hypothetical protein